MMSLTKEKPLGFSQGRYENSPSNNNQFGSNTQAFIGLEEQFLVAMKEHGISCSDPVICDGEIHRFASGNKISKDCWYFLCSGGLGYYGDWSKGYKYKFIAEGSSGRRVEFKQIRLQLAKIREEQRFRHEETERTSIALWESLIESGSSAYLQKKQINAYDIRFDKDGTIYIPIREINGKLWSLQKISGNGYKQFMPGGRKKGCFHLIGEIAPDKPLYIAEGYATAASVHMATNCATVVAFDASNIFSVIEEFRNKYSNIEIIIAADNDMYTEQNTGKIAADKAALKYNCKVIIPTFANTSTRPTDFNDLHVLEGIEQVKAQLCPKSTTLIPTHFKLLAEGLFYTSFDKNGDEQAIWLSSPINVEAHFCDKDDNNHGMLLSWNSAKTRKEHKWAMPAELLAGDGSDIFRKLLSEGVEINSSRRAKEKLLEYIATFKTITKLTCITTIGWYENYFVLPDTIYPKNDNLVFQSELARSKNKNSNSGTLKEWQEHIAKYAAGNSRLILALSCAFAAPLLKLAGEESGAIHLYGNSSLGKTTALYVAASVWGGGGDGGFIKQWRATCNALEIIAVTHRDSLLPLDELGQADSRSVGDMVYMLANNQGKGRLKSSITLRDISKWRVLILSSGETTLQAKVEEAGKKAFAGMEVRFVSIPAALDTSYGIFENLHGFTNGEELSRYLKEVTSKYYGTAIREFLSKIVHNTEQLTADIKQLQKDFIEKYAPLSASGQVKRVAGRFGLIAAAGELAIILNILPLSSGDAIEATAKCFNAWLYERGTEKDFEQEDALNHIKAYFEKYGDSKFISIGDDIFPSQKPIDRIGYKQKISESYHYYVFPESYKKELCKGSNHRLITKYLIEQGYLLPDNQGKNLIVKALPDIGKVRVYHFSPNILI